MTRRQRLKRSAMVVAWRIIDPATRLLAGNTPWWVLIETVGRRTGKPRRTPLASGPFDGDTTWLISEGEMSRPESWRRFEAKVDPDNALSPAERQLQRGVATPTR
jgi:F420H(2)-dependent quinone reductase